MSEDKWIEIEFSVPNCKAFVLPTSYALMTSEERERKWDEDVANNNYPISLWIQAVEAIRRE
ncbi:hypothetical protein [Alicyclobacillus fastidiosus]|uniref:Uncharacterized protein n=1 Tax=Alicyclobacillus fastidiosus TaxID=392011 RepID=A0ABV5AL13_9BACL